ncbi:MAG: polysaccharide biosynthesis/export family protein [Planctomycetes bacterium]|nr:polysaccharide biosynthesis/export family protein [Planctomycetota bacterium]
MRASQSRGVLGIVVLSWLLGGCFRILTQPRYEDSVLGPSDGKAVNLQELVTRFPELEGIVTTAPDYYEEVERERKRSIEEGGTGSLYREVVIEPNYLLTVEVWGEPEVTRQVYIRADGGFDFPLIGEVQAAGKTIHQVRDEMAARLRKYFRDPQVIVNATPVGTSAGYTGGGAATGTITVVGLRNGNYPWSGKENIMQVLAAAGGVPENGEWRQIRLIRRDTTRKTRGRIIIVDYWAFLRYGDVRQNIPLLPGDIVFIPKHWTWGEQFAKDWDLAFHFLNGTTQIKSVKDNVQGFQD